MNQLAWSALELNWGWVADIWGGNILWVTVASYSIIDHVAKSERTSFVKLDPGDMEEISTRNASAAEYLLGISHG